jgi:NTE family protein
MRIGLALGGGAVRGLAHLGVLSTLLRAGISFDYVAGCSAGAVIGASYCAGLPMERIEELAPRMAWRFLARPSRSRLGLFSFERLERWVVMMIGDLEFEELEVPLALIASDAYSGERVVLCSGRVAPAVRASCSIPGLFTPVEIDGRHLVDGGIVDNLPADAVREMGADYVIGVDVFEPHYHRSWGPLARGLTAVETLVRHAGGGVDRVDCLIRPKTAGYSYHSFSRFPELLALGTVAAEEALPALLADLQQARP